MECTEKDKTLKMLDALKELVTDDSKPSATAASLEETQKFNPILDLGFGVKLRYKGGASLKFPKKGEEVYVYSVDVPGNSENGNMAIYRDDFTFLVKFGDECIREFSADSRYFERVE